MFIDRESFEMIINELSGVKRGKRGTSSHFLPPYPSPFTPATQAIINAEFERIYMENENRAVTARSLHSVFWSFNEESVGD